MYCTIKFQKFHNNFNSFYQYLHRANLGKFGWEPFHPKLYSFIPLRQYRSLFVLNRIGIDCCCSCILPSATAGAFCCMVLCFSSAIKFSSQLPFVVMINFVVCGILLLIFTIYLFHYGGGKTYRTSLHLLWKFREIQVCSLYRRKYMRANMGLRMYVGSFFYVKQSTFRSCMKFVLDQILSMLFSVYSDIWAILIQKLCVFHFSLAILLVKFLMGWYWYVLVADYSCVLIELTFSQIKPKLTKIIHNSNIQVSLMIKVSLTYPSRKTFK